MNEHIIVQAIEFNGNIGVTDQEMRQRQPIRVDLDLAYPPRMFTGASGSDEISQAIDYSRAIEHVIELGTQDAYRLLERLADRIIHKLFAILPISHATVWVRKVTPPLKEIRDSVGIRLSRARADILPDPKPAGFLVQSVPFLPKGTVLDVAAGGGRNTMYLAGLGYSVDAVDRDQERLQELDAIARQRGLPQINTRIVDLEADSQPLSWAKALYDVVIVFFYLYRPLFPALLQAVRPGGILIYETFLIDNHFQFQHPKRKEFCLMHNELLHLTSGFRVLRYEEGQSRHSGDQTDHFTARIIAQKELPLP